MSTRQVEGFVGMLNLSKSTYPCHFCLDFAHCLFSIPLRHGGGWLVCTACLSSGVNLFVERKRVYKRKCRYCGLKKIVLKKVRVNSYYCVPCIKTKVLLAEKL